MEGALRGRGLQPVHLVLHPVGLLVGSPTLRVNVIYLSPGTSLSSMVLCDGKTEVHETVFLALSFPHPLPSIQAPSQNE